MILLQFTISSPVKNRDIFILLQVSRAFGQQLYVGAFSPSFGATQGYLNWMPCQMPVFVTAMMKYSLIGYPDNIQPTQILSNPFIFVLHPFPCCIQQPLNSTRHSLSMLLKMLGFFVCNCVCGWGLVGLGLGLNRTSKGSKHTI